MSKLGGVVLFVVAWTCATAHDIAYGPGAVHKHCSSAMECDYPGCSDIECPVEHPSCIDGIWSYWCTDCARWQLCGCRYYNEDFGASQCPTTPLCPVGTYSMTGMPLAGMNCTQCTAPAGSYCKTGSTSASGVSCPSGYFCNGGSTGRQPCSAGEFLNFSGAGSANECRKCRAAPGYFCPRGSPSASGFLCVAGHFCPGGSEDKSECPRGYFCPRGSVQPTACPSNSSSLVKSDSIRDCACNAGSTGESCIPCAKGTYKSASGSVACIRCPAGKYLPSTGNKEVSACLSCSPGKYSSVRGSALSSDCLNCEIGKYSNVVAATAMQTCLACPTGTRSPLGSLKRTQCVCIAGMSGPAFGPCEACPPGFYKTASGESECLKCPGGFTSPTGSTNQSSCVRIVNVSKSAERTQHPSTSTPPPSLVHHHHSSTPLPAVFETVFSNAPGEAAESGDQGGGGGETDTTPAPADLFKPFTHEVRLEVHVRYDVFVCVRLYV